MKTSSCKTKGRRLQQVVRDTLIENFKTLEPDDIRSTGMGQSGTDLQLSPAAKKQIPFAFECKNQEKINIWASLEQAIKNAETVNLKPALVFKRNRSKIFATIYFDDFIEILKELHELREFKKTCDIQSELNK